MERVHRCARRRPTDRDSDDRALRGPHVIPTCPYCSKPLLRMPNLVAPYVALGCRSCNAFRLANFDQWVPGGPHLSERLRNCAGGRATDASIRSGEDQLV